MKLKKRKTDEDKCLKKLEYFKLLLTEGDSEDRCNNSKKIKEALKYAHNIRKFEIELFWKRATYFWAFIAVIALAYGSFVKILLAKTPEVGNPELFLFFVITLLNSLGLIISAIWYFVMRGSKFWQANWETHIDMLEFYVTGHLHKVLFKDGCETILSVTKLSQAVALCCIIIWGLLLLFSPVIYWYQEPCITILFTSLSVFPTIGIILFIMNTCKSSSANGNF